MVQAWCLKSPERGLSPSYPIFETLSRLLLSRHSAKAVYQEKQEFAAQENGINMDLSLDLGTAGRDVPTTRFFAVCGSGYI